MAELSTEEGQGGKSKGMETSQHFICGFRLETGCQLQHVEKSTLALELYTSSFKVQVSLIMTLGMLADLANLYFLL